MMPDEKVPLRPDQFRPGEPVQVADGRVAAGPPPATQPSLAKKETPGQQELKDGTREIIETIVFVVVLVLLLKTFLAEAFVIPTGSMATTLLGYHKEVTCQQCGFAFPVNASDEVEKKGDPVIGAICPNCRFENIFAQPRINGRNNGRNHGP
jgi:signal peptidase I